MSVARSNFSGVSAVASHVLVRTLMAKLRALSSDKISSLYSCFMRDVALARQGVHSKGCIAREAGM